jgi:hypothetical protein
LDFALRGRERKERERALRRCTVSLSPRSNSQNFHSEFYMHNWEMLGAHEY